LIFIFLSLIIELFMCTDIFKVSSNVVCGLLSKLLGKLKPKKNKNVNLFVIMKRYHYVDQLVFSYLTWDDLLNNVSLINVYFHKIIENMEIKKIQLNATKWAKHYYYLDAEHHIIFSDDHYIIFNHKNLTFQYYHHVLQPYHITPAHHLVGFLTSIEYEQKGFGRWQIYNPDKRKKKKYEK